MRHRKIFYFLPPPFPSAFYLLIFLMFFFSGVKLIVSLKIWHFESKKKFFFLPSTDFHRFDSTFILKLICIREREREWDRNFSGLLSLGYKKGEEVYSKLDLKDKSFASLFFSKTLKGRTEKASDDVHFGEMNWSKKKKNFKNRSSQFFVFFCQRIPVISSNRKKNNRRSRSKCSS